MNYFSKWKNFKKTNKTKKCHVGFAPLAFVVKSRKMHKKS